MKIVYKGNKTEAYKYTGFAKNKLFALKKIMSLLEMPSLTHTFNLDKVFIRMMSTNIPDTVQQDKIFITGKGLICNDFVADVLSGTAPLEVAFTIIDNIGERFYTWDFGNGANSDSDGTDNFTYETPGEYTVKASFAKTAIWQDLRLATVSNIRSEQKLGATETTEAAAWSSYSSASWTSTSSILAAWHYLRFTGTNYFYWSRKYTVDIDLTSFDNSNRIYFSWAFDPNQDTAAIDQLFGSVKISFIDPITALPVQSTLNRIGASTRTTSAALIPLYWLFDLTPYAGKNLTDILIEDGSGFPRAPIISWNAVTNNGWRFFGARIVTRVHSTICSEIKGKYITVE